MKRITSRLTIAAFVGVAMTAFASGPATQQGAPRKAPTPFLCGQMQMQGAASGRYDTQQACNAGKQGLETNAKDDGKAKCNKFCTDMSCTATTIPERLTATSNCRGPDPANQKHYGTAETGQFTCRCTN